MKLTVQLHSHSGSFASPDGRQSLFHCQSKAAAAECLIDWADKHPPIGSDEREAYAFVWKGHLTDTTDQCPDYELSMGPRLGVRWSPC